ncbi:IS200/IS605 family element transposase accessory protein TnpB, partial [Bacillus tropicus]|nr:IS200/IS605 family element transposase accessory protein TnpB [Bacillus tropicus]
MEDKEQEISHKIVNFTEDNPISDIKKEKQTDIRQTARASRKNEKNLHTWSFYRLSRFIAYKAM